MTVRSEDAAEDGGGLCKGGAPDGGGGLRTHGLAGAGGSSCWLGSAGGGGGVSALGCAPRGLRLAVTAAGCVQVYWRGGKGVVTVAGLKAGAGPAAPAWADTEAVAAAVSKEARPACTAASHKGPRGGACTHASAVWRCGAGSSCSVPWGGCRWPSAQVERSAHT